MKIEIEIDDEELEELVKKALVERLAGKTKKSIDYVDLRRIYTQAVKEVVNDPSVRREVIAMAAEQTIKAKQRGLR